MAVDVIEGIEKEPEEIKFKGIDLATNWLEPEEDIESSKVRAYKTTDETIREIDLTEVKYVDINVYDADHELIEGPIEWEMSNSWETIVFLAQGEEDAEEVTDSIIVNGDSDNPSSGIDRLENGRYKIGLENGVLGERYHIVTKFDTQANRIEWIHFPLEIVEVKNI